MGKVQKIFGYGFPGAITRSVDDIVIAVKNASAGDIAFGSPVFLTENGAVPFDISNPQEFEDFLGFAVRVADKTPEAYPRGQNNTAASNGQTGAWHAGDVMEVLVRGCVALPSNVSGARGGRLYIRKSDGMLTGTAGASGTTVCLENCRIRAPRTGSTTCCEAVVNKRNIL